MILEIILTILIVAGTMVLGWRYIFKTFEPEPYGVPNPLGIRTAGVIFIGVNCILNVISLLESLRIQVVTFTGLITLFIVYSILMWSEYRAAWMNTEITPELRIELQHAAMINVGMLIFGLIVVLIAKLFQFNLI